MPARRSIRLMVRLAVYAAALLVVFIAPTIPTAPTVLTVPTAPAPPIPAIRLAIGAVLLAGLVLELAARRRQWR